MGLKERPFCRFWIGPTVVVIVDSGDCLEDGTYH
jgi:hypothetical protein